MKKMVILVLSVSFFMFIVSCGSTGNTQENKKRPHFLNPEDIVGKNLVGSDETGSYRFTLKEDGTLEYAVNENVYYGRWSFNAQEKMYPYNIVWTEGETRLGYIMDFMVGTPLQKEGEITLNGHSTGEGSKTFSKTLRFEESEDTVADGVLQQ